DSLAPGPLSKEWRQRSLAALTRAKRIGAAINEEYRRLDALSGAKPSQRDWSDVHIALAITYGRLSEPAKAAEELQHSGRQWPEPECFEGMAAAYRDIGDLRQSAVTLLEGLVVNTSHTKFASDLVELYRQIDPKGCAVRDAGGSAGLNVQCPLV